MFRKLFLILSVFRFNITNALHFCTFKTPTSGLFMSAKATLPCVFEMRKGVNKVPNKYIINSGLPECRNCKHFAPHNSEEHKYSLATCLLYGQKDIISGKITFEFAQHVRNRDGQCSREGLNYEPISSVDIIFIEHGVIIRIKMLMKKDNHFYFDSFSVDGNQERLKIEIDRLIRNRDNYKSIHFYLNNNGGGDIVPAHMILRCLTGKKESWMKNIKKIQKNKEILEWDCWREELKNTTNYSTVKKLNLNSLLEYDTKYAGKIHLYMDKQNGSAAWFFITYLIYAFSHKISRYSKQCYGQSIKYGTIESDSLVLHGHSGTTSGDGNSVSVKTNNIEIVCPTEQFISSSIKVTDWNRFWIERQI